MISSKSILIGQNTRVNLYNFVLRFTIQKISENLTTLAHHDHHGIPWQVRERQEKEQERDPGAHDAHGQAPGTEGRGEGEQQYCQQPGRWLGGQRFSKGLKVEAL